MKLKIYQIDAFASQCFEGNPAAVVPLDTWLDEEIMQAIASENNLSETAFFCKEADGFRIRWFTPIKEIELCGHATLASAFVLFNELGFKEDKIFFQSLSGRLGVVKNNDMYTLDFPAYKIIPMTAPQGLISALGKAPQACYHSGIYIAVFEDEQAVADLKVDFERLIQLELRGVVVTARAGEYDFVSRFFAPKLGINEDPVTGSSFTKLAPYWGSVLKKKHLHAKQISQRGGEVWCEVVGERVLISGKAVKYLSGEISLSR